MTLLPAITFVEGGVHVMRFPEDEFDYNYDPEACSWHLHNLTTLVATLNWGGGLPSEVLEARAKLFAAVPELVAQYAEAASAREGLVEELRLTREREVDLKLEILRLKEEAGKASR